MLTPRLRNCPGTNVAELFPAVPQDAEIVEALLSVLDSRDREALERRFRNPQVAVLEAIWIPGHSPGKMNPARIAERLNTLLRSRSEFRVYSPHEVGWILKKLGLWTHRDRNGRALDFSADVRQRLHDLAVRFELQLQPVNGCPLCAQVINSESFV